MAKEDIFVEEAMAAAEKILSPPLIRRHAPLLYEVTVNNRLEVTVNPRKPYGLVSR